MRTFIIDTDDKGVINALNALLKGFGVSFTVKTDELDESEFIVDTKENVKQINKKNHCSVSG